MMPMIMVFPENIPILLRYQLSSMSLWILFGISAALLTMFGFIPQLAKMYRTRSVSDVSLLTLCQFTAGVSLWALYGYLIRDPVIIVANIVSLLTLIAALAMYLQYRQGAVSTPAGVFSDTREVGE
jgi:MtN3 and saliva related transmembrane protein